MKKLIRRENMIETDNLIIRQSKWEDLEDFYRWERLPEVTEFFSMGDEPDARRSDPQIYRG